MKIVTAVCTALLLAGCAGSSEREGALPYLPTRAPPPPPPGTDAVELTALYSGRLVVERGCVRLDHGGHRTTLLWTAGTTVGRDSRGLFLRHAQTGALVRFGTQTQFGGGQVPEHVVASAYPQVAQRCDAPYGEGWIP